MEIASRETFTELRRIWAFFVRIHRHLPVDAIVVSVGNPLFFLGVLLYSALRIGFSNSVIHACVAKCRRGHK